jgi:outer membrane protein, heavy metal efflux system
MRTRTWRVVALLLFLGRPALCQNVLTEADAQARLSTDSPRVRAIRATVDLAAADVLAAGRWPNPRVTFNRESVAGVRENMVTVAQVLPITGRRQFEVNAATALAKAAAGRADDELRSARAELRVAYAELVSAQTREAELSRARDRLRELADVLGRRESAGEAAGYDRMRAEREAIEMEGEWIAARTDRTRAQAAVASFFAEPGDITALVVRPPAEPGRRPLPPIEELITRAEMTRGEAVALRFEMESARFADSAAGRRLVPEPEVVAGTKSSNLGAGDVGSVLSIHASIPLFDRASPERAMAQARLRQAEARAGAFRATLAAQIAALHAIVIERREAADRYRASAVGNVDQLERIAQVSYDAGERGILELLDAFRSGAAARTRQAELDAGVRQAEIELEFVSGWEI